MIAPMMPRPARAPKIPKPSELPEEPLSGFWSAGGGVVSPGSPGLPGVAGIDRGRRRCGLERRADIPFVVLQSEVIEGAVAAEVVGEFLRYAPVEVTGDHAGLAAVVFCRGRGRGDDTGQGYGCGTEDR